MSQQPISQTNFSQSGQVSGIFNEQTLQEFQAGVTAVLRSWSPLKTAVANEWGGIDSKSKANDLRSHILQAFAQKLVDQYELEDNLLLYMEEEFSIVLEDSSEQQVAMTICSMYQQCCQHGNYTTCRQMVSLAEHIRLQEAGKSMQPSQIVDQGDLSDDEGDIDMLDNPSGSTEPKKAEVLPVVTTEATSFITGTLHDMNQLPPASNEVVAEYANLDIPVFGSANNPIDKVSPPPRQLGETADMSVHTKSIDEDGFLTVKTKRGAKRT